ncbi:hypothetical protein [uncultured Pelagimonas sp.]|uniref:hypothetical protein n=1 Tax=uncultured Pelagimonas sp. TaxID=1618102 RepID=UPI0026222658|nr:hypothetical protein [uncultured Pelagimonas sp.]
MATKENIETIKQGIDVAHTVSEQVSAWATHANELAEAGKSLGRINQVMQGMTAFEGVSAGFALAGAGLEIVTMIIGGPSPDEVIMEMIAEVSNKIDRLSDHMDHQFEKARTHSDRVNAYDLAIKETDVILNLKTHIDNWRNASDADKPAHLHVLLEEHNAPDVVENAAHNLHRRLTASSNSENVLRAIYADTHGGMGDVSAAGASLIGAMVYAPMAYAVLSALRNQNDPDNNPLMSPAGIAAIFDDEAQEVANAIREVCGDCLTHVDANITAFLPGFLETVNVGDYGNASRFIRDFMGARYYWQFTTVVIFEPVTGWDKNGSIGGQNRIEFLRHVCADGTKASLIISWGDPIHLLFERTDVGRMNQLVMSDYNSSASFPDTRILLDAFQKYKEGNSLLVVLGVGIQWNWSTNAAGSVISYGRDFHRKSGDYGLFNFDAIYQYQ